MQSLDHSCCCQPATIRFRGQLLLHTEPGQFGFLALIKWNNSLKVAFCIYMFYLCLIIENWLSETCKYAKISWDVTQMLAIWSLVNTGWCAGEVNPENAENSHQTLNIFSSQTDKRIQQQQ